MYFITTIFYLDDISDRRCIGYLDSFEEAEECVLNNACDMFETLYNYVVIEKIPSGLYTAYDEPIGWYKWNEIKECYEKIETPKWALCLRGFAIG